MKASEYIVRFLEKQGVRHAYGFQGTMVMHVIDSIGKSGLIENHSCYNEQAAAFAACGSAKLTGQCAFAYSTSGPGAINLLSGIADAYYDSAPVLFITGQVNTYDYRGIEGLRQDAFQQTPVVDIVSPVCKKAYFVDDAASIPAILEEAWILANSGRKGPVLLDIPMNIQRAEIDAAEPQIVVPEEAAPVEDSAVQTIIDALASAKRPILVLGNAIGKDDKARQNVRDLVRLLGIPAVSSLLGSDILDADDPLNFGVLGYAYGHRHANLLTAGKSDLILSLGSSLCTRQTGGKTDAFAPSARIIRCDIDPAEIARPIHADDVVIEADVNLVVSALLAKAERLEIDEWRSVCSKTRELLEQFDAESAREPNAFVEAASKTLPHDAVVVGDVGQHMMWMEQSFRVSGHRVLYSGGHGAMGFALPAAIGVATECPDRPVAVIAGDGAFQMNIQELQWVVREQLPIAIIVMNNQSLGLIRQQQNDFFDSLYFGAANSRGFTSPDFAAVARAYGIGSLQVESPEQLSASLDSLSWDAPVLIEVLLPDTTAALPKTYFGDSMTNQKPYISEALRAQLEEL